LLGRICTRAETFASGDDKDGYTSHGLLLVQPLPCDYPAAGNSPSARKLCCTSFVRLPERQKS
jgi:hypothetical protein